MLEKDLLQDFTILDFTHRLPGPLGCLLLSHLGARILKVEDQTFKDPFIEGLFPQIDESFTHWYRELNHSKEILRLDFKSDSIKDEIQKLLHQADGVLLALPPKLKNHLGLTDQELRARQGTLAVVELAASFSHQASLHDLNALALTGLLKLHTQNATQNILPPPFLPIAGISFGAKAALDLLAALLSAQKQKSTILTKTFLFESTEEIFSPFWPKQLRETRQQFLHNGRYPCYTLYRLKDGHYAALASVEPKFWNKFCELFELKLSLEDRFHYQSDRVFQIVSKAFLKKNSQEVQILIQNEDLCLNLV